MAEMSRDPYQGPPAMRAGSVVSYVGAGLSLALMVGVGIWGYNLIMRDVSGVPVVRAAAGEMRMLPERPGGSVALNAGLSVNELVAEGEAAPPEDRLVLAPGQVDLEDEDLEVAAARAAEPEEPVQDADEFVVLEEMGEGAARIAPVETAEGEAEAPADPAAPMTAEQVLALADEIAAGVEPMAPVEAAEETAEVETSVSGGESEEIAAADDVIPASVPGVARSLRPAARPLRQLGAVRPVSAAPGPEQVVQASVTTEAIPVGTRLVQLGAFESPEIAAREWVRLSGRFGDYMGDKRQIIQKAESAGRTFYRLRAMGFADLSDARRFCSALVAEGADCIPVVVR